MNKTVTTSEPFIIVPTEPVEKISLIKDDNFDGLITHTAIQEGHDNSTKLDKVTRVIPPGNFKVIDIVKSRNPIEGGEITYFVLEAANGFRFKTASEFLNATIGPLSKTELAIQNTLIDLSENQQKTATIFIQLRPAALMVKYNAYAPYSQQMIDLFTKPIFDSVRQYGIDVSQPQGSATAGYLNLKLDKMALAHLILAQGKLGIGLSTADTPSPFPQLARPK